MLWYNGYGDSYGIVNKVTRHKRTQCRACKEGNNGGTPNPEHVVEIIANGGPTGKLMLCKPHALELAKMIADAANEIDDVGQPKQPLECWANEYDDCVVYHDTKRDAVDTATSHCLRIAVRMREVEQE